MARNHQHGKPRGRKPPLELPHEQLDAERERKQARKAKLRADRAAKRRKGHS